LLGAGSDARGPGGPLAPMVIQTSSDTILEEV
jgi:hypothetical protein